MFELTKKQVDIYVKAEYTYATNLINTRTVVCKVHSLHFAKRNLFSADGHVFLGIRPPAVGTKLG